jgi:hypothetical protein
LLLSRKRRILWVYEHLDNSGVTPGDAPVPGAWHLLTYARAERSEFFKNLLPKAMPKSDGACPECEQRRKDQEHDDKLIDLCSVFECLNAEVDSIVCPNCRIRFMRYDAPEEPHYDPATIYRPASTAERHWKPFFPPGYDGPPEPANDSDAVFRPWKAEEV